MESENGINDGNVKSVNMNRSRQCVKCKKNKILSKFIYHRNPVVYYENTCKECKKKYMKIYRQKNKDKLRVKRKENYTLEKGREIHERYKRSNPWMSHYSSAKNRCNNINGPDYKWYGERGIKFLLTKEQTKILYIKFKAFKMKNPTIDRKDKNGNYTIKNTQFIERSENSKRRAKYGRDKKNGRFTEM